MRRPWQKSNGERGQMMVVVGLLIVVLLGFVGIIIDGGRFFSERRQAQNAADEAALAAAHELFYGGTTPDLVTAAQENAAANGYDNDGASNTVTVNVPPTSGEFVGDPNFIEVIIDKDVSTFLVHLIGSLGDGVTARGVAGVVGEGDGEPGDPVGGSELVRVPDLPCGSPTVDGRVTTSDGYTKIGNLVGGTTDYGDAFYTCDGTYHYFAVRLNGPTTGGAVANENVYGCEVKGGKKHKGGGEGDCTEDYNDVYNTGWDKHDFKALLKSDRARFQTSCDSTEVHDFVQDYLREDGGSWASDTSGDGSVIVAGPDQSASSLEWNLEHPSETGWGDDPGEEPYVPGNDKLGQSPPFNPLYPDFDPEYDGWEWEMIYEFRVPMSAYDGCSGPTYFGIVPFEGESGPVGGIHSSPAKEEDGGSVFLTPIDIRLVE